MTGTASSLQAELKIAGAKMVRAAGVDVATCWTWLSRGIKGAFTVIAKELRVSMALMVMKSSKSGGEGFDKTLGWKGNCAGIYLPLIEYTVVAVTSTGCVVVDGTVVNWTCVT